MATNASPLPALTPCPECKSERIWADGMNMYLAQNKFLTSTGQSQLKALVCTNCGYTAFYATSPQALIEKQDR